LISETCGRRPELQWLRFKLLAASRKIVEGRFDESERPPG
jgi:hypothetical protein